MTAPTDRSRPTRRQPLVAVLALAAALGAAGAAAQTPPAPDPSRIVGTWARQDGNYTIVIKAVDPQGRLDALYLNPRPVPVAMTRAAAEGGRLRVSLELRAPGYDGSVYDLAYDARADTLSGTYRQAVSGQTYPVTFLRR